MKKKLILGTSDTWWMSRSSHRPSKPAYYIEDCRISSVPHLGRWTGGDLRSNYAWDLAGLNYNLMIYTENFVGQKIVRNVLI